LEDEADSPDIFDVWGVGVEFFFEVSARQLAEGLCIEVDAVE
jgi:hypothetical protein